MTEPASQPIAESGKDIPGANAVLVMGLLSVMGFLFTGLPGIIFSVLGLFLAGKAEKKYSASPGDFNFQSFQNLKAGKTTCRIGLVLSFLVFYLFFSTYFGGTSIEP